MPTLSNTGYFGPAPGQQIPSPQYQFNGLTPYQPKVVPDVPQINPTWAGPGGVSPNAGALLGAKFPPQQFRPQNNMFAKAITQPAQLPNMQRMQNIFKKPTPAGGAVKPVFKPPGG